MIDLDGLHAFAQQLFTMLPGVVESYDPSKYRADVRPIIRREITLADGTRSTEAFPVLTQVPVVFPGSGGVKVEFEISKGDPVLLLFSMFSLDRWLAFGGSDVDPKDDRSHALSDAVAIPGIMPFPSARRSDTAIVFTGEQIHAGGNQALVTQDQFEALCNHISTVPRGGSGSAAVPVPSGVVGSGTTKLKGG